MNTNCARARATILNKRGLHARASAKIVEASARFKSEIHVIKDGTAVNGRSIMGLMTGGPFHVTGATVADLDLIAALAFPPSAVDVDDTAAHIQADLIGGTPSLVANRALLNALHVNDAGTITLPVPAANLAFGGPGKRTLYLTARQGLYRIPMRTAGPARPGK